MDHGEVPAQLIDLRVTHQEFPSVYQVGEGKDSVTISISTQQEFLGAPSELRDW